LTDQESITGKNLQSQEGLEFFRELVQIPETSEILEKPEPRAVDLNERDESRLVYRKHKNVKTGASLEPNSGKDKDKQSYFWMLKRGSN
jgi:hypothetical protein